MSLNQAPLGADSPQRHRRANTIGSVVKCLTGVGWSGGWKRGCAGTRSLRKREQTFVHYDLCD